MSDIHEQPAKLGSEVTGGWVFAARLFELAEEGNPAARAMLEQLAESGVEFAGELYDLTTNSDESAHEES